MGLGQAEPQLPESTAGSMGWGRLEGPAASSAVTLRTLGALGPRSCAARHSPRDLVLPMPALLASHCAAHIPAQSLQPRVAVSSVCVLKVNSVLFFPLQISAFNQKLETDFDYFGAFQQKFFLMKLELSTGNRSFKKK